MRVNSVNQLSGSFGNSRDDVKAFVNLDNETLKRMAYADTMSHVNQKRYKRQEAVLDLALPLAGGLSAAAVADKGLRLKAFGKGTAAWGLFLLGIGAVFGAENALRKHSEKFDNFVENHKFLTFATSVVGAYFAGKYTMKGGAKLAEKVADTGIYKNAKKHAKALIKEAKDLPVVKSVSEKVSGWMANTPHALKEVAKTIASWAPFAVIVGQFAHSANYTNSINRRYHENYDTLKQAQLEVAKQYSEVLERNCFDNENV